MAFSFAAIPLPVLIGVPIVGLVAAVIIYEVEKNKKAAAAPAPAIPVTTSAPAGATGPVTASSVAAAAAPVPLTTAMLTNMGFSASVNPTAVASTALALVAAMAAQPSPPGNTAALTAFQAATGLPQTGWYDTVTSIHLQDVLSAMGVWQTAINQLPNESWPNKPSSTPVGPLKLHVGLPVSVISYKPPSAPSPATTGYGPQIVAAAQQAYAGLGAQPPSSDFTNNLNWQVVAATLSQLQNNPTTAQLGTALTNLQQNGSAYATSAYNILNRVNQVIAA